jgi:hypothetical protein
MASRFPFPFVLELLYALQPRTKPMFGAHAIYIREKLVLIVRQRETHPEVNGVWMATSRRFHESLRNEFPSMHSVYILSNGKSETDMQMIHEDDENFEPYVTRICELILKNDPRIGRIPKARKKKKS